MTGILSVEQIMRRIRDAQARGLENGAGILGDEVDRLVPVDTGALRASRRLVTDGDRIGISYGHGLPDARAIFTHEEMQLSDSKWLERGMVNARSSVARQIADEIRRKL